MDRFDEIHEHNNSRKLNILKGFVEVEDIIEKAKNRQVGEVHPSGKYVWTALPNGKFDWRANKGVKQETSGGEEKKEPESVGHKVNSIVFYLDGNNKQQKGRVISARDGNLKVKNSVSGTTDNIKSSDVINSKVVTSEKEEIPKDGRRTVSKVTRIDGDSFYLWYPDGSKSKVVRDQNPNDFKKFNKFAIQNPKHNLKLDGTDNSDDVIAEYKKGNATIAEYNAHYRAKKEKESKK